MVRNNHGKPEKQIMFTEFIKQVDENNVKNVTITGNEVKGDFVNENASFRTLKPPNYPDFYKMLLDKKIPFEEKDTGGLSLVSLLVNASPFILLAGVLDLHDAPDAERRQQGPQLRQEPRAPAFHAAEEGHV